MIKKTILIVLCVSPILLHAIECKLSRTFDIRQEEVLLRTPYSFCVTHRDEIIVVDGRAGDIKIYDSKGKFLGILGKKGPGPGEYMQPVFCDYQASRFAVIDMHKKRLLIYRDEGGGDFRISGELPCWGGGFDLRIRGREILVSGLQANREKRMYSLYQVDMDSRNVRFLVPYWDKFGQSSWISFMKKRVEIANAPIIGLFGFCDHTRDHAYFVWEGDLRIIKTDIKTGKSSSFGGKTANYRQPEVSKAMNRAYQARDKAALTRERQNLSCINGLFAHENYIGLLYGNYFPQSGGWRIYLQLYSPEGRLLEEMILPEVSITIPFKPAPTMFFDKSRQTLHYMYHRLDEEDEDRYSIAVFRIVQ